MRFLYKFSLFFIFLCLMLACPMHETFCAFASEIDCPASSMVVMATLGDKVLYSKDMTRRLAMASTTKIVTAITCLDNCEDIDRLVTVPKSATLVEGSSIYLREGERLTIRQLLYGLMLQSGNDSAETLALAIAGSKEEFASLMNETARKCGAENSSFVTPHGLDDKNHYTTALDLAKITSFALKNPIFKEIVSTKSYKIPATEHNSARTLVNKNKLLSSLEGATGVKTGYTKKSGRCLVSSCERDGMEVVCVVLNCGPMFEESASLINKAFKEYRRLDILPSYKFAVDIPVENGVSASVRLYNKNGFSVIDREENADRYTIEYDYADKAVAPIEKGQALGSVKVYYDNSLIFTEKLCSIESIEEERNGLDIKDILDNW